MSSFWSAAALRVVVDCSSIFVVTVFSVSTSVPSVSWSCWFCSCSIRMSAIICWCSRFAAA